MAVITKGDFLKLHASYNDMLSEIAILIAEAAKLEFRVVDSQVLLEVCQKHSRELKKITQHITGD
jgi:hypothetical protein